MTSKRITTVLGQLGLTQVRYVSPVRRGAARGLASRVYDQVEREFGVLAPSLVLLSPSPQVLAASWVMLRETMLVSDTVDRAAKEAVATAVSLGNACPWCVAVHSTMLSGLAPGAGPDSHRAGPDGLGAGPDGRRAEPAADPRLGPVTAWARDCGTQDGALSHEPACPAVDAPELIGTVVLFHYYNRMVNVFLTDVPLPPGAPRMALGPVMRILGTRLGPAADRPHEPGASLDLLPAAPLAADLSWISGDPSWTSGDPAAGGRTAARDAFARGCAAIDAAGVRSVPPSVRELVTAELGNWHGEHRGPSRAWADSAVSALPAADQPAGRLAMLTALASAQVDRSVVREFQAGQPADASLTELTAWASLAAARRAGSWIPVAAAPAVPDPGPGGNGTGTGSGSGSGSGRSNGSGITRAHRTAS